MNLDSFFHPRSIAIIGASSNPEKLGAVIMSNILDAGYEGNIYPINIKSAGKKILGKVAVANIGEIEEEIDLVVIAIPSKFVEQEVDECIAAKAKNIIIISAGFGEVENDELEQRIAQKCQQAGVRVLGPNCLGLISTGARLNASFSDGFPENGNVCLISQSGAFCTAALDWSQKTGVGLSHLISLGNKSDITEIDILESLKDDESVEMFAIYLESVSDGKKLLEVIEEIGPHKPVIILEPGKSERASIASSSHTGSLAPNFQVLQTAYIQAGAVQVYTLREMFSLIEILSGKKEKNFGSNVAILTNAGGVGVVSTDLVDDQDLNLPNLSSETLERLAEKLPGEASLKNPIDIIGDADADRYKVALEVLSADPNIDQILVLLTPQRVTQIQQTAQAIIDISKKTDKNIVVSFLGGEKVEVGRKLLQKEGVPEFQFPQDAIRTIGLAAKYEEIRAGVQSLAEEFQRGVSEIVNISDEKLNEFRSIIQKARKSGDTMLSAELTREILDTYDFSLPRETVAKSKKEGLKFASELFPKSIVLKITSPHLVHKTELKGVIAGIKNKKSFNQAWDLLLAFIEGQNLKDAAILVQEQIDEGVEVILGVHTDAHFGRVMIFGSGGVYTELIKDTAITLLPMKKMESLIMRTKAGTMLQGVRGQKAKCLDSVLNTMKKLERLALELPEITSIDCNPVIVTDDRAMCVDVKLIVEG